MSTPFQNRLVGTMIVAAVAIIFLPDLLDGDKQTYQADFDAIPTAPKMSSLPDKKQFPSQIDNKITDKKELSDEVAQDDLLLTNEEISKEFLVDKTQTVKVNTVDKIPKFEPKDITHLPEKSIIKEAWVIQLGSFRHEKNVKELVNKLKANGYTAFTKPIDTKNGTLTKVFIGPDFRKSTLEEKLPLLKELTNVQGNVSRFYPSKQ